MEDKELLENFKEDLQSTKTIKYYKQKGNFQYNYPLGRLVHHSKHAVESLQKHGVLLNKTFNLTFPDWLDEDLVPHFVRGYIDGDGSIWANDIHSQFLYLNICGTQELLNGILNFFCKNNRILSQRWPERNNNNYQISFTSYQALDILDEIYKNATIYLTRKHDQYLEGRKMLLTSNNYKDLNKIYKYTET